MVIPSCVQQRLQKKKPGLWAVTLKNQAYKLLYVFQTALRGGTTINYSLMIAQYIVVVNLEMAYMVCIAMRQILTHRSRNLVSRKMVSSACSLSLVMFCPTTPHTTQVFPIVFSISSTGI